MKVCEGLLRTRVDNRDLLTFVGITESRSPAAIEVFHDAGFDVALIDREHTALNSETIADLIRVARCLSFPCMVRVCEDCYHELNRTLDQAPDGIFVPRIKTREQAENVVRTVKYKPLGIRGLAGSTCPVAKYRGWSSVPEQIEVVNRNLVVGIQIETAEALEDLDGILSVKGIDIAVVGGDDLTMGMGIPGQTKSKEYFDALERVIAACQRHHVLPGIAAADPETALYWIEKGMRVIWYACDVTLLWQAAHRHIHQLKQSLNTLRPGTWKEESV